MSEQGSPGRDRSCVEKLRWVGGAFALIGGVPFAYLLVDELPRQLWLFRLESADHGLSSAVIGLTGVVAFLWWSFFWTLGGVVMAIRGRPLRFVSSWPVAAVPVVLCTVQGIDWFRAFASATASSNPSWISLFGLLFGVGVGLLLTVALRQYVRVADRFVHRGHCSQCGYNLTGLPEPRCPECGTAFEAGG